MPLHERIHVTRTVACATMAALGLGACADRETAGPANRAAAVAPHGSAGMVLVPAGTFTMGSLDGAPDEQPVHEVEIAALYVDAHEVTNAAFARFVSATGYRTEAERWGWSVVFSPGPAGSGSDATWWQRVDGASWRHPRGPGSSIDGFDGHPVVQVSWHDAAAYCAWTGRRLPTEAEWEYAARGGIADAAFPWGSDPSERPRRANTWNGAFPHEHHSSDGHAGLAAVGRFDPNGYGLHDMAGNVWEWVADWYAATYADHESGNPTGPARGTERVLRGGSWLCADNYCRGYRVSHRNKGAPDSAWDHTGFRCVRGPDAVGATESH